MWVCTQTFHLALFLSGSLYGCNISLELGALDFLERPAVVFVRLKESAVLSSALEAPMPVRFVFVLVGPSSADMDYHETGRAMAALLADKVSADPGLCKLLPQPKYDVCHLCSRSSIMAPSKQRLPVSSQTLWLTSWTVASSFRLLKSKAKPCSHLLSTSRKSCCKTGTRPPIRWPVGIPRLAGVPEISVLEFMKPCSTHRV